MALSPELVTGRGHNIGYVYSVIWMQKCRVPCVYGVPVAPRPMKVRSSAAANCKFKRLVLMMRPE